MEYPILREDYALKAYDCWIQYFYGAITLKHRECILSHVEELTEKIDDVNLAMAAKVCAYMKPFDRGIFVSALLGEEYPTPKVMPPKAHDDFVLLQKIIGIQETALVAAKRFYNPEPLEPFYEEIRALEHELHKTNNDFVKQLFEDELLLDKYHDKISEIIINKWYVEFYSEEDYE